MKRKYGIILLLLAVGTSMVYGALSVGDIINVDCNDEGGSYSGAAVIGSASDIWNVSADFWGVAATNNMLTAGGTATAIGFDRSGNPTGGSGGRWATSGGSHTLMEDYFYCTPNGSDDGGLPNGSSSDVSSKYVISDAAAADLTLKTAWNITFLGSDDGGGAWNILLKHTTASGVVYTDLKQSGLLWGGSYVEGQNYVTISNVQPVIAGSSVQFEFWLYADTNATRAAAINGLQMECISTNSKLPVIVFDDNFSNHPVEGEPAQWSDNFGCNPEYNKWHSKTNSFNGTMGVIQRPYLSTNDTGVSYGGLFSRAAFTPEVGDLMSIELDWIIYTDGRVNMSPALDLCMSTDASLAGQPTTPTAKVYNSADTMMGFRISQKIEPGPGDADPLGYTNGAYQVLFSDNGTNSVLVDTIKDTSLFGLAPEAGDNDGQPMRVKYTMLKSTNENVWVVGLEFSNMVTAAEYDLDDINITNSTVYGTPDFYFACYSGGGLTNEFTAAGSGFEYDNFLGKIVEPDPPSGYPIWALQWLPVNLIGQEDLDYDGDGVNNLYEYGLGGNPTNSAHVGTESVSRIVGNTYEYIHVVNKAATDLTYSLSTRPSLTSGVWIPASGTVVGESSTNLQGFAEVTNNVGTTESAKFIKLIIED